jgi:CMP-N-acetylneuraminic acid synthetase
MDVLYSWLHDIKPVYVLEINACNPLLSPETINRALDYFNKNDLESLFGIIRRQNFYYRSDSSLINHFNGDKKYLPTLETKMVEPIFEAAHSIYLWKAERVIKEGIRWANKPNDPFLFEVPPEEAFDIDWPWQFELAEQMYLKKMNKK